MKKLTLITFVAIFFVACNDSKSEEGDNKTPNSTESVKPSATGDDAALTAWLSGKMLTSPMMSLSMICGTSLNLMLMVPVPIRTILRPNGKLKTGNLFFMGQWI